MTDLDRYLYAEFKRINGFTDEDVDALSRYCLGQSDEFPSGLEK